jgi:hypothetical protein
MPRYERITVSIDGNCCVVSKLEPITLPGRSSSLETYPFRRLFLVLCAIWLALHLPVLLGVRVIPRDAMDQFYPSVYYSVQSLRHGLAPWWNPYIYSGYPQVADPQGMLFSPLLMAWMLVSPSLGSTWFMWGVLLHLLMGGTAMLGLLRRDGANAFGALLGATVFMAGGVAASRLEHTPLVLAYGYAPVVLLALRHFFAGPRLARAALLGLAAGAMATQLVQVSYLFVLMFFAYGCVAAAWHERQAVVTYRWRWCAGIVVAVALALLLALPQCLFTWAFLSLSNRASVPLAAAGGGSLDLGALLTLLGPNSLHALRGQYTGPANQVEAFLYIGALPLLVLVTGVSRAWREPRQRRQLWFFAAVAVAACLYMLGTHTPLYGWLYGWLPGLQHFRRPSDAAYLLNFALAVVAGLSASHVQLESRRVLLLLLAIATGWLALASSQMRDATTPWQAPTVVAALFAAVALWRLRKGGTAWRVTLWLLALLVVDYRCFNLNGTFNQWHDRAREFTRNPAANWLAQRLGNEAGLPPRLENIHTSVLWDDLVMLRNLPSTQGYNPLRYALYDRWYGARENSFSPMPATAYNASPSSALHKLLDVQYLVVGHLAGAPSSSPGAEYERVFNGADEDIWQSQSTYPRVLSPTRTNVLALGAMPEPAAFADTDFTREMWLTPRDAQDEASGRAMAANCKTQVQASLLSHTPTRLAFRTQAQGAGWVLLNELDFPGWQAELDGGPIAIHRANGMFRAVCVPGGEHRLRFEFHPWAMVGYAWAHRR